MTEPYDLTAAEAAAAIREGRLSSLQLVESLLDRIARLDPLVHAWVRLDPERARAAAAACDAERAEGRLRGPLHGVPVGLKDIYQTEGLTTEAGSAVHARFVPERDARTVALLRQAGAIVLGKTETTQFAYSDPAPTRNPWNLDHTPGGFQQRLGSGRGRLHDSAGAWNPDGGMILRPAAFCGVAGFKPTAGRLSLDGIFPLSWSLDHAGPIARSVDDLRLCLSLLDDRQRASPGKPLDRPPRLGLLRGRFLDAAQVDTAAELEATAGRLAKAGALVREVRLADDFGLVDDVHHIIMRAEAAAYHAADHARMPQAYRPNLRAAVELGALIPATLYLQALRLRSELQEEAARLLDGCDCLMMPSAPGEAPPDLTTTGNAIFNGPWSLFGMPALTIPSGLGPHAMPLGLQLVGRRWDDGRVLDAGSWCEHVLGRLPLPAAIR